MLEIRPPGYHLQLLQSPQVIPPSLVLWFVQMCSGLPSYSEINLSSEINISDTLVRKNCVGRMVPQHSTLQLLDWFSNLSKF